MRYLQWYLVSFRTEDSAFDGRRTTKDEATPFVFRLSSFVHRIAHIPSETDITIERSSLAFFTTAESPLLRVRAAAVRLARRRCHRAVPPARLAPRGRARRRCCRRAGCRPPTPGR